MPYSHDPVDPRRRHFLRELNASVSAIEIEGDRLSKRSLEQTGVEAPPKR
jgi:hypothetical protein